MYIIATPVEKAEEGVGRLGVVGGTEQLHVLGRVHVDQGAVGRRLEFHLHTLQKNCQKSQFRCKRAPEEDPVQG
jgi:hypothetical protein